MSGHPRLYKDYRYYYRIERRKRADKTESQRKIDRLEEEIRTDPRKGTGNPERLRWYKEREIWSRRVIREHRLVYEILEEEKKVIVYQAYGHYND